MRLWLLPLLLIAGPLAAAESAVQHWLDRMSQAVNSLNYDGTFVHLNDGKMQSMRVVHVREGDWERERIFSLNGEAREILRDNNSVTCILPRSHAVTTKQRPAATHRFKRLMTLDPQRLQAYYRLRVEGQHRVANHETQVLTMEPRDDLRFGHRLYLDDETGFPLQWEVLNESGGLVSSIMFTRIELGDQVADSGPLYTGQDSKVVPLDQEAGPQWSRRVNDSDWSLASLPAGYQLLHHMRRTDESPPREHLVLSDGLASLSLSIEPAGKSKINGAVQVGAMNIVGREVAGQQVMAVGEVPVRTLQLAVQALRKRQ